MQTHEHRVHPHNHRVHAPRRRRRREPNTAGFTLGEEVANSITHGLGLAAGIAGASILLFVVAQHHNPVWFWADAVYAASLVTVYAASTLYHAITDRRLKRYFRLMDRAAIYVMIAGTYTPFAVLNLGRAEGLPFIVLAWALAVAGVIFTALMRQRMSRITTVLYLAMGWMGLLVAKPAFHHLNAWGLIWILGGGICYTIGALFYSWERLRYGHAIWHLFVLAGSICHYIAVFEYAMPA